MKGTLSRVFGAYPLAFPVVLTALAAMFPGYFMYDGPSQRVTMTFTLTELAGAFFGGQAIVGAVFAKWGIKR